MKKLFLLYIILFPTIGLCQTIDAVTYLTKLDNETQFKKFEGQPLSDKYGGAAGLKVVVAIASSKIFFLESKLYQNHYYFFTAIFGESENLFDFNVINF